MKNYTLPLILAAGIFSFHCFAQRKPVISTDVKLDHTIIRTDERFSQDDAVVAYRVEEKIKMNFGSSTTSYTVSDLSLINTNDLGPNNTRIVTPMFVKAKTVALVNELPTADLNTSNVESLSPVQLVLTPSTPKERTISIDILETYERVLETGYITEEMVRRVGDKHYFENDFVGAARWYCELFALNTPLEAVYYYRYAQSLFAIQETEKAVEMMALYESKK